MKLHTIAFSITALFLASAVVSQSPNDIAPTPQSTQVPGSGHGLPGQKAGTEQWLVQFKKRSFNLLEFRKAMYANRPWKDVKPILDKIRAQMLVDQAPFKEAVEKLGGRVYIQYWIVNAAAVEIPHAKLAELRKLANVTRVDPNLPCMPAIKIATNGVNHNSDAVNLLGFKGKGVATAIVDTGLDSLCGTKGRPHRTFYEDGNLSKRNRLLANLAAGSMPADNAHSHGTGVAGIVAGGNWGTTNADHGHAPHADFVGYSISNSSGGNSSLATMAKAWQWVARDAAKYNIKTANNSYHGSPDPLNVSQQALDSAALNADVMIVVAAGNTGARTTSSLSCANGLAVAAVNATTHAVASFSARGPMAGDTQRFYPDIAACGVGTIMPRNDSTNANYIGSGTSMASPQVCGAATLIRAQVTTLKADETKAILLAAAFDISDKNKTAPYNTRNAYGLGLLKDDAAMKLARNSSGHGRATVTTASKTWQKSVAVTKGKTYRAVAAWMRQTMTSKLWSNLDVEILSGTTVIARSNTPRNLYEGAIFLAPATGNVTFRVTGTFIELGKQEFAWAFTEGFGPPVQSEYSTFGSACNSGPQGCTQCDSRNWTQKLAAKTTTATKIGILGYGYPQMNPCGIDLYASARSSAVDVTIAIQEYDSSTGRPGKVLASGKVRIGTTAGTYHAKLSPNITLKGGGVFFVTFDNSEKLNLPVASSGATIAHAEFNGSWSGIIANTAWQYRFHCDRGLMPPVLSAAGKPTLGTSINVNLSDAPGSVPAIFVLGASNTKWGTINLPLTYAAPCQLLVSPDIVTQLTTSALGTATVKLTVPNQNSVIGFLIFNQYLISDATRPLGVIVSNGGQGKVGQY